MLRSVPLVVLLIGVSCESAPPNTPPAGVGSAAAPASPPVPIPPPDLPSSSAAPDDGGLTLKDVATYPRPGTHGPGAVQFSPDGAHLSYLWSADGSLSRDLFIQPVGGGPRSRLFTPPEGGATEASLSPAERLRRERMRTRALGVTRYAWAKHADRFLVPLHGDVWVQDGLGKPPRKLVDTDDAPALDPRFSPDGEWVAYVHKAELYVVSADGGRPTQLTRGAREAGRTHGLAEYIAQEEMDRHHGYWWSRDASKLAFAEVDERHIPAYRISHLGNDTPRHEDHAYPFAGSENARVRLGVVRREGGRPQWLDLNATGIAGERDPADIYLARVHWMPDGSLLAQVQNREQTRLHLIRYATTGQASRVLEEATDVWINLNRGFHPLVDVADETLAGGFVWMSERSGFAHAYLYDRHGSMVRALTAGEWMVDRVVGVDEKRGDVYFTATRAGPTERHLYKVPLAGGEPARLTADPGMHAVVLSPTCDRFVDHWSRLDTTPRTEVRSTEDGSLVSEVAVEPDPRVASLGLTPPVLVTLQNREGLDLHGALYKPEGDGPFPTLISVYGGPHAQRVQNDWSLTVDMRAQYLRSQGILVFKLDNRGSARRGLAFEGAIKHDLGNREVLDQVDGVQWLVEQSLADRDRVGIYGWSYGGYLSAMALLRAPQTFKVAVAGAPVTHWDGYDTHYTERYMGLPAQNPEGYARASLMAHVEGMQGKLMLVHGLIDENVHFRHTARLINALMAAGKDYTLLMFPDERHMPRRTDDLVYMERRIRDFVLASL